MLNKQVEVTLSLTKNSTEKTVKKCCRYTNLPAQYVHFQAIGFDSNDHFWYRVVTVFLK